jgi:hypothetical protein
VLPSSLTHAHARQVLSANLEALDEVHRVLTDERAGRMWVICKPGAETDQVNANVRTTLASFGLDPGDVPVSFAIQSDAGSPRRIRLRAVERMQEGEAVVRVRVTLEWEGRPTSADVAGEPGGQVELRTTALATLQALELVVGQPLGLRLAGVKALRVFDSEIMAVAFSKPGSPPARYIGTVLVGSDPLHAAAAAVLDGLNRLVGMYVRGVED